MRTIDNVKENIKKITANIDSKVRFTLKESLSKDLVLCKCYVMATGKCRNGFVFLQEDIAKVINSIYYKPVVGRIHVTNDGQIYMGEHDSIIENGLEYSLTVPFGVVTDIPATYEEVTEEDGTKVTYLVVEIILWVGRYPELFETIYSDEIWFNQSMEITINAFSPYVEDKRYKHVTDWEFDALCLLGKSDDLEFNTEPCFPSACVKPFNLENTEETFSVEKVKAKYTEDLTLLIEKVKEVFKSKKESENEDMADKNANTTPIVTSTSENFALSQDKIREKLRKRIREDCNNYYVWVMSVFPDYCYYSRDNREDESYSTKTYKQGYAITNDEVGMVGEPVEVFVKFLTAEEMTEIDNARGTTEVFSLEDKAKLEKEVATFKADKEVLEAKVSELEKFKLNTIDAQIEEEKKTVFSTWKPRVKEETYKAIEEASTELTAEEIKAKFKFAYADEKLSEDAIKETEKANFSATKTEGTTVKIPFSTHSDSHKVEVYGGIFEKFGTKAN